MADDKGLKTASDNDQLVRVIPGTDIGGHDTAGTDGKKRTERPGDILGTPDPTATSVKHTATAREQQEKLEQDVVKAVDKANREELPKLGGSNLP